MEKTKAYRSLLKGGVTLCVVFLMLFLSMLYSDNFWPLLISIGLLGRLSHLEWTLCILSYR
jgi:hypothetical protein